MTRSPLLVRLTHWAALLALSTLLTLALELIHLPAAFLLGPMLAGIVVENLGTKIKVPPIRMPLLGVNLAQAVVGLLIARSITPEIMHTVAARWPLFAGFTLATLGFSALLGWWFTRLRLVPGTTAIWGLLPGGASAVVLMSGAYGADVRIVAFMQYLRVLFVTVLASLIAGWSVQASSSPAVSGAPSIAGMVWLPPLATPGFAQTVALIVTAIVAGRVLRFANGALLLAMLVGAWLHDTGRITITLPLWLLAASFCCLGWSVGLRFTREVFESARRVLPATLLSIAALITACGGLALLLSHLLGVDALTAYLATSPGGADSVAAIAASSPVNAPLVMAFQIMRLMVVVAIGPAMSRFIAARIQRSKSL